MVREDERLFLWGLVAKTSAFTLSEKRSHCRVLEYWRGKVDLNFNKIILVAPLRMDFGGAKVGAGDRLLESHLSQRLTGD